MACFSFPYTVTLGSSEYATHPIGWHSLANPTNLAADVGVDCDDRAFGGTGRQPT